MSLWPVDLNRLFVIRDSTINFTGGLEGVAATVVSGGMLRADLDRLAVINDGLVDFPLRAVSEAAMVEGIGVPRRDLECLSEICDRSIVVASRTA